MSETIIKVQFFRPVEGKTEFFFGSLAAIYEQFTPEQIGCGLTTLWSANITPDAPKSTRLCVISKHNIGRKPQNNKQSK